MLLTSQAPNEITQTFPLTVNLLRKYLEKLCLRKQSKNLIWNCPGPIEEQVRLLLFLTSYCGNYSWAKIGLCSKPKWHIIASSAQSTLFQQWLHQRLCRCTSCRRLLGLNYKTLQIFKILIKLTWEKFQRFSIKILFWLNNWHDTY